MIFEWLRGTIGCGPKRSNPNQLSEAEIIALKRTWARAKKHNVGQHILRALILQKPQFRIYFGIPEKITELKEMQECKQFLLQTHRIQNFLDNAVSALGFCPMTNVLSMAHQIGKIHFYRGVNFGADNWLAFKKVTVQEITKYLGPREYTVVVTEKESNKAIKREESLLEFGLNGITPAAANIGWEKFMAAIVREMKKGFLDEARRNCTEEDNSE